MDPRERAIAIRLVQIAKRAMTGTNHLAQTVPWESRGVCAARAACSPACIEAQRTIRQAEELLEEQAPHTLALEL